MRALLAGALRKESAIIQLTRKLVLVESPSDVPAAVNACAEVAAAHAKSLGARIKLHRPPRGLNFGAALEARFGRRSRSASSAKPLLLLGHLDTVWPLGTLKTMPCRVADGRLWGPGTLDMKAGAAMALTAIEMLTEAGALDREIVLLLNPDEEVGSPFPGPSRIAWLPNAPPFLFSSRRRAWPTKLRAREPATGASISRASPLMPAWTSKKARAQSANWRMWWKR